MPTGASLPNPARALQMHMGEVRAEQLQTHAVRLLPLEHHVAGVVDDTDVHRVEFTDERSSGARARHDRLHVNLDKGTYAMPVRGAHNAGKASQGRVTQRKVWRGAVVLRHGDPHAGSARPRRARIACSTASESLQGAYVPMFGSARPAPSLSARIARASSTNDVNGHV